MTKTIFAIHTFTMNADRVEDRIRLDAADPAGATQTIWITRRLASQCVPHLGKQAEKRASENGAHDVALTMAQQRLRLDRDENPTPPVQAGADAPLWLCRTMHFSDTPEGIIWIMTDDATQDARMHLNEHALRAVLDVFLTSYRALEWDVSPFPDWVVEAAAPAALRPEQLN